MICTYWFLSVAGLYDCGFIAPFRDPIKWACTFERSGAHTSEMEN